MAALLNATYPRVVGSNVSIGHPCYVLYDEWRSDINDINSFSATKLNDWFDEHLSEVSSRQLIVDFEPYDPDPGVRLGFAAVRAELMQLVRARTNSRPYNYDYGLPYYFDPSPTGVTYVVEQFALWREAVGNGPFGKGPFHSLSAYVSTDGYRSVVPPFPSGDFDPGNDDAIVATADLLSACINADATGDYGSPVAVWFCPRLVGTGSQLETLFPLMPLEWVTKWVRTVYGQLRSRPPVIYWDTTAEGNEITEGNLAIQSHLASLIL